MLLLRGSFAVGEIALASLLMATILLAAPSRSYFTVAAKLVPMETKPDLRTTQTKSNAEIESERQLFELPSPFDFVNGQCAKACDSQEEQGEGLQINPCPKCHDQYTPCNFCCYQGASSLKLRYFGCGGIASIVLNDNVLGEKGCNKGTPNGTVSNKVKSGVRFVDCDCYNDVTNVASSTFGDIASCDIFEYEFLGSSDPEVIFSSFDICLVSTTDRGGRTVANFSQPLPDIIGLQHLPNGNTPSDDSVTFFETTCDEKGVDSLGNFAYPLFPGYGKFAGTCPYTGYIDFENQNSRLPDDLVFVGQPPSTSFFYRFIDGTSVGFWPKVDKPIDHTSLFFNPTFETCNCLDCNVSESGPQQPDFGTHEPSSSFSDVPSRSPSLQPSTKTSNVSFTMDPTSSPTSAPTLLRTGVLSSDGPSMTPSSGPNFITNFPSNGFKSEFPFFSPSTSPSERPSLSPSSNPSESPSSSYYPSSAPSDRPSQSNAPSLDPSSNISEQPSAFPSESPSSSYYPSFIPSDAPSKSITPSISPSSNPSEEPTNFPSVYPSLPPSKNPSESPSSSYYPSVSPSDGPSESIKPSISPSSKPSGYPSTHPTHLPSEMPSSIPSGSPTEGVSTGFPTGFQTTTTGPTENATNEDCVDETECFIFAVGNCVDKRSNTICIPYMNGGFRRFLEKQIWFHQSALAELVEEDDDGTRW